MEGGNYVNPVSVDDHFVVWRIRTVSDAKPLASNSRGRGSMSSDAVGSRRVADMNMFPWELVTHDRGETRKLLYI
jgi:hypothetical protein